MKETGVSSPPHRPSRERDGLKKPHNFLFPETSPTPWVVKRTLISSLRTYYLVVYIGVIHLKFDIELEVVPQYSADNICGHIISATNETLMLEKGKISNLPGMAYMSIGISDSVRMEPFMKNDISLTLLVHNCTMKRFLPSNQWEQTAPSTL